MMADVNCSRSGDMKYTGQRQLYDLSVNGVQNMCNGQPYISHHRRQDMIRNKTPAISSNSMSQ